HGERPIACIRLEWKTPGTSRRALDPKPTQFRRQNFVPRPVKAFFPVVPATWSARDDRALELFDLLHRVELDREAFLEGAHHAPAAVADLDPGAGPYIGIG